MRNSPYLPGLSPNDFFLFPKQKIIIWKKWEHRGQSEKFDAKALHHTKRGVRLTWIVRRARHAGHCWRSKDELISDVLLWTFTYGRAKAGRPARTHIQQLCEDTGCSPEDQPEAMNDREKWRERVRDIRTGGTTWWWWRKKECHRCFEQWKIYWNTYN